VLKKEKKKKKKEKKFFPSKPTYGQSKKEIDEERFFRFWGGEVIGTGSQQVSSVQEKVGGGGQ